MKAFRIILLMAGAGVASCLQPAADPAPVQAGVRPGEPLTLPELQQRYDSLAGQRVRVEGFLISNGPHRSLLQGRLIPGLAIDEPSLGAAITHACTFQGHGTPLAVHNLRRRDINRLALSLRDLPLGSLRGQKVVLEGMLRPMPGGADTAGSGDPPISFVWLGPMTRTRIIAVEQVYCRGSADG